MYQLTVAVPCYDSVQSYVRQKRELALRNPEMWATALHELSSAAENDVIFAAMDGDECLVGRRLIHHLRTSVIDAATDRAKDELETLADPGVAIDGAEYAMGAPR